LPQLPLPELRERYGERRVQIPPTHRPRFLLGGLEVAGIVGVESKVVPEERLAGQDLHDFLHRLQTRFFVDGVDVGKESVLMREAVAAGANAERFAAAFQAPATMARVRAGFEIAKAFGTSALPSVQIEIDGKRGLVAGGYVDSPTLLESVRGHLRRLAAT